MDCSGSISAERSFTATAAATTTAAAAITTAMSAEPRLTVLSDNRSSDPSRFHTEHGLSILLDTGEHRVLLDTGVSDLFLRNARKLGINLADADYVFLSHGHHDHAGGLGTFLAVNSGRIPSGTRSPFIRAASFSQVAPGSAAMRKVSLSTVQRVKKAVYTNSAPANRGAENVIRYVLFICGSTIN